MDNQAIVQRSSELHDGLTKIVNALNELLKTEFGDEKNQIDTSKLFEASAVKMKGDPIGTISKENVALEKFFKELTTISQNTLKSASSQK